MEASFPREEYRSVEEQLALFSRPEYQVYGYLSEQVLAAFLAIWDGPSFVFLEHFAVDERFRGGGLGSKLLLEWLELDGQTKPVILEIEPPVNEIQKRRAAFYERNGFVLSNWSYEQPALSDDKEPVPVVLMTYPKVISEQLFTEVKDWVFEQVYGR
ncbi:GNAT family N-acetyltransferase [Fundicoccus culcitae]|uniref:GNAT family N-acetyltransferase n=1 Tax=Fundicoccus culcitae TaxID=2969821 RepID=A0ABY5P8N9_9LACT|nr:GNAT family N-acetyltransferase [Fundicoccus culcitae]UUX34951.1 GNAT family N-acetyltransferase [Fundicoccus culcitae]